MKAPNEIYVREYAEGLGQMWDDKERQKTSAIIQHKYIRADLVEQPASEDLEKEIADYIEGCLGGLEGQEIASCARYFYELGCRRTAEKYDEIEYNRQRAEEAEINNNLEEKEVDLEKEMRRAFQTIPGTSKLLFNDFEMIARHFAEWGAEHA